MDPFILGLLLYGGSTLIGGIVAGIQDKNDTQQLNDDITHAKEKNNAQMQDELDLLNLRLDEDTKNLDLANSQKLESLQQQYDQTVKDVNLEYNLAKDAANREADISDNQMDMNERLSSSDFNLTLRSLIMNQSITGLNYNQAEMQIGQNKGSQYAALAGNGARAGGSIGRAVELQSAVSEAQLQAQQDAQRNGDQLGMQSALNNVSSTMFGISQNRQQSDYIRGQYMEGGSAYQKRENTLGNLKSDYDITKSQTDASYLRQLDNLNNMYNQNKTNLENYYTRANGELDYQLEKWNNNKTNRWLTNTFKIGGNVLQTGMSIEQAGKYFMS